MTTTIRIERTYPHPPARVWRALTEREAVSEWLMPTDDFDARVGAKFVLRAPKPVRGWRGFVECEVLECEPERVLSYSWVGDERARLAVRFELSAVPGGTKLAFEHTGFPGVGGWMLARFMMGPGWRKMFATRLPLVMERYASEVRAPRAEQESRASA